MSEALHVLHNGTSAGFRWHWQSNDAPSLEYKPGRGGRHLIVSNMNKEEWCRTQLALQASNTRLTAGAGDHELHHHAAAWPCLH